MKADFRMYAGPEFVKIASYLADIQQPQPNPMLSLGWTAEVDGQIAGISVIQGLPIVEPFHVLPQFANTSIALGLFRRTEKWIKENKFQRVLMHTDDPTMKIILERAGAEECKTTFYEWRY